MVKSLEERTGELFGGLWRALSDDQYRESVELFRKRFIANGFDLAWFADKTCLDAGCGSGRYAVAMAMHGAANVVGCDVSVSGLETARQRASDVPNVSFRHASVLDLPFDDETFDFTCCAGVLHHTRSIEKGIKELHRVTRSGGKVFLLLYGAGGLRWRLIESLRPLARKLGLVLIDEAIGHAALPANNRKHFLDDLFVEIQEFTSFTRLEGWLSETGFVEIDRWTEGRFDHESSPEAQIEDMSKLLRIFDATRAISSLSPSDRSLANIGVGIARTYLDEAQAVMKNPEYDAQVREDIIIGDGNHRVIAVRG